jgi:hypothetical protein
MFYNKGGRYPYVDPMKTKSQLARDLGISRKTLYEYHNLACVYLQDYLDAFPKIPRTNALPETIKDFPLTDYQCWVIRQLLTTIRAKVTRRHLEKLFDANQYVDRFSHTAYQELHQESVAYDDVEGLRQVA